MKPGVVVAHVPDPRERASDHERQALFEAVRRIAALRGCSEGGAHEPGRDYGCHVYFVPNGTLTSAQAAALGIAGPGDLFGGVVPHPFVATKAISHPLLTEDANAPAGWRAELAAHMGDAVLPGYTVFDLAAAREAGRRMLAMGPVRLKPVRETGGRGQVVARHGAELQALLETVDPAEVRKHGLVLEQDLTDAETFSIGQVQVGDLVGSYYGTQKLTHSNRGDEVYGGSDLTVIRGGFDALLASGLPSHVHAAVDQARRFDAAVRASYPGFYATRSNYDVLRGRDAQGRWHSGVLEQSWRIGGATGPELAALESFHARPECTRVRACGFEFFGDSPEPPAAATVHYRGTDPHVGRITKYTLVEEEG